MGFCLSDHKLCSPCSSVEWHAPSGRNRPLQNKRYYFQRLKAWLCRVPGHFSSNGQSDQAASIFAQVKQTIAAQRQAFSHNTSSNMEHQVDSGLQHADLLLAQVRLQHTVCDAARLFAFTHVKQYTEILQSMMHCTASSLS